MQKIPINSRVVINLDFTNFSKIKILRIPKDSKKFQKILEQCWTWLLLTLVGLGFQRIPEWHWAWILLTNFTDERSYAFSYDIDKYFFPLFGRVKKRNANLGKEEKEKISCSSPNCLLGEIYKLFLRHINGKAKPLCDLEIYKFL